MDQAALRLLDALPGAGHAGEVYSLAYAPDGAFALSAGWDGQLRLWETSGGAQVTSLEVSHKPLSACAVAPDGRQWLAGCMEGLLSAWDAAGHRAVYNFLAHTRPVSSIRFAPDGKLFATTSWDRQVALRKVGKEREPRVLAGHGDIVAGCRFTPDGRQLLSWSYDGTLILWDVDPGRQAWATAGHADRVLAAAVSPDGRWAASGSRDGVLKVWDLAGRGEVGGLPLEGAIVGCPFLLDGASLLVVRADGWLLLLGVPTFEVRAELETGRRVLCAELAPTGAQLALGGEDGHVSFVEVNGLEGSSLIVTATPTVKPMASGLGRLLGRTRPTRVYQYTCPVCRHEAEAVALPAQPIACPVCRRQLRVQAPAPQLV